MIAKSHSALWLILFIVALYACNKAKNPIFCSWKIEKSSGTNPFLKDAEELTIFEDHIVFSNKQHSRTFPIILRDDHMIMQTQTTKKLFLLNKRDDSSMIIKEKYTSEPLWIQVKKLQISNHEK